LEEVSFLENRGLASGVGGLYAADVVTMTGVVFRDNVARQGRGGVPISMEVASCYKATFRAMQAPPHLLAVPYIAPVIFSSLRALSLQISAKQAPCA
jgi:hypothetical protein